MKSAKLILVTLMFFSSALFSQVNEIDSLRRLINKSSDTTKVNYLNELSQKLISINIENALDTSELAIKISKKSNFNNGLAQAYKSKGIIIYYKGQVDSALYYFKNSLEIYKENNDKINTAKMYNNISIIYKSKGDIKSAIEGYQKAIDLLKQTDDKQTLVATYINISNVYRYQGDFKRALSVCFDALKIFDKIENKTSKDSINMAHIYKTIGNIYTVQENYKKAKSNFNEALVIYKKLQSDVDIADIYNNLGNIYEKKDNPNLFEAKKYYTEALSLYSSIDKIALANYNIANVYLTLHQDSSFKNNNINYIDSAKHYIDQSFNSYNKLGDKRGLAFTNNLYSILFYNKEQYQKSIKYSKKSLNISQQIGDIQLISKSSEQLYQSYKKVGNYKKAVEILELFVFAQDSIFNENNEKELTQMALTYEFEKEKQKRELEYQEELKRQKIVRNFSLLVLFLVLIALVAVFFAFRTKKRKNEELQQKNAEIMQQKEEIETQRDEIEAQKEQIEDQSKEIEKQRDLAINRGNELEQINQDIQASIHYALRIQKAILPSVEPLNKFFSDYFIFYKPRDIVSGDFYWLSEKNQKIIVVAADCTGHGVPGAFMSMLGVSFLNQIVTESKDISSEQILNKLREMIIIALKQDSENFEGSRDGMDLSLIIFDKKNNQLQYSGAYNPIYIISDNKPGNIENSKYRRLKKQNQNRKLYEIKANRMPIGVFIAKPENFTKNTLKLSKDDQIYMFSDGYPDLYSRNQRKKFTTKRFKELLIDSSSLSLSEQNIVLEQNYKEWVNGEKQIDDIIVFGVKI